MKYLLTGQETDRLIFRLLTEKDFDTWLHLFEDKNVAGYLGMQDIPTAREQCEKWFEFTMDRYRNDTGGMNVLIHKTTGDLIGQCGLLIQEVDGEKELEIGYSILSPFRNRGYATGAAKKCRDFAFENNYTDSLISIVNTDNIQSEKVALKNGMSLSKTTVFKEMPVHIFRINRPEWVENNKNSG